MLKTRESLIASVSGADPKRNFSIVEIATVVGDSPNRAKSVFDKCRTLFRPVNSPVKTQKRIYANSLLKSYALHQILCDQFRYTTYRAEEILLNIDNDTCWTKYKESTNSFLTFILEQQEAEKRDA